MNSGLVKADNALVDLSELVPYILNSSEATSKNVLSVLSTETKLEPFTFETQIDSDHLFRKPLRIALEQLIPSSDPGKDITLTVELPPALHDKKEAQPLFEEPSNLSYEADSGLFAYLDCIKARLDSMFDQCTPAELHYVPAEIYKQAYEKSFQEKKAELTVRYGDLNSGDLLSRPDNK